MSRSRNRSSPLARESRRRGGAQRSHASNIRLVERELRDDTQPHQPATPFLAQQGETPAGISVTACEPSGQPGPTRPQGGRGWAGLGWGTRRRPQERGAGGGGHGWLPVEDDGN